MCYTLPKIWQGRISKYWDKYMPANYPNSSSEFAFNFATEEEKAAVTKFEEELGTEESEVAEVVGEGNFVSDYFGTYDVKGKAGERTLLSPEKIETADDILAFHFDTETQKWEQVEDASLEDGYVWGTLESFSPVAIIATKKDIETATPDFMANGKWIVANGNSIQVYTDEEDSKIKIKNLSSGKVVELGDAVVICGGSIDGSVVDNTNISVLGVVNESLGFYAGSYCWDNEDEEKTTTNKSCNITVTDSKIRAITGSGGRVKSDELNITVKNSSVKSHVAMGESWNQKASKDANGTGKNLGLGSVQWLKKANVSFIDGSYVQLLFTGGNTGYTYTDNTDLVVKDSKIDYLIGGGSNGRTRSVTMNVDGLEGNFFQTNNRGEVDSVVAKIDNATIPNLFVFGDATDTTVTGVTKYVAIDTFKGTYGIKVGTQGGDTPTDMSALAYVKYSRSASVTVLDEDKALFGDKLISK